MLLPTVTAEEVYRTCRDFIMPLALQLQSIVPNPPSDEPHRSLWPLNEARFLFSCSVPGPALLYARP